MRRSWPAPCRRRSDVSREPLTTGWTAPMRDAHDGRPRDRRGVAAYLHGSWVATYVAPTGIGAAAHGRQSPSEDSSSLASSWVAGAASSPAIDGPLPRLDRCIGSLWPVTSP